MSVGTTGVINADPYFSEGRTPTPTPTPKPTRVLNAFT